MTKPLNPPIFATPEDVETAFYDAIEKQDVDALMACWSEEEEVVCVHPTGQQLTGLTAIRESWQAVLGSASFRISVTPVAHWQGMLMALHHQLEMLLVGKEETPHGPLHVTQSFIRGAHGWRLTSRHASAAGEPGEALPESNSHTLH